MPLEEQRKAWEAAAANKSSNSSSYSTDSNSSKQMAQVLLGHLASYEGMGRARVECVAGCECKPATLDGHWKKNASLQVNRARTQAPVQQSEWAVARQPCFKLLLTLSDSHSPLSLLPQVMLQLAVTEAPACRLRVSVLPESSSGGGHKVKLTALVVLAGGSSELLSQPGRLEFAAAAAAAQGAGRR